MEINIFEETIVIPNDKVNTFAELKSIVSQIFSFNAYFSIIISKYVYWKNNFLKHPLPLYFLR